MTLDDKKNLMKELVDKLNCWTKAYDEGHPNVSDKEWDDVYFQLIELEKETGFSFPQSPSQKVNYQVLNELKKVEHNHPMLSLDKTKNWDEFLDYFSNNKFVMMPKLDGLTCSLRYLNGKLVSAETRGDGVVGEDVLHNALVIDSIPKEIKYYKELVIDGEIICFNNVFEQKYSNNYANPRNFAAGSIRLLDSKECADRNLTFVVWNVIKGFEEYNENSFTNKMSLVKLFGFYTIPLFELSSNQDQNIASIKEHLINLTQEIYIPIDGIVGRFDDISYGNSLGSTEHHSRAAYAFKFYDTQYDTTLINIDWSLGRTGVLTPVAIFNPVDIEGTIVERASLHNLNIMESILGSHPYFGQKIKVSKRNMIIPQVEWGEQRDDVSESIELAVPAVCPYCGFETKRVSSIGGTDNLVCFNSACDGKFINRLDHFCGKKGLDIKGISSATLEKLITWGWINHIYDIFYLEKYYSDWINKDGFGEKSVSNILSSISASIDAELSKFIAALGIPLIGSVASKEIAKIFPTWEDFRKATKNNYDFCKLYGIGEEMRHSLLRYNYEEADILASILHISNNELQVNKKDKAETLLTNKAIVITGKLTIFKNREELAEKIESAGGKVINKISKNTFLLINNDIESKSQKNLAAKKLNIPIISEKDFFEKYLKNI